MSNLMDGAGSVAFWLSCATRVYPNRAGIRPRLRSVRRWVCPRDGPALMYGFIETQSEGYPVEAVFGLS